MKTLATVQSEGREPDFFEILKAVILNGSVGLGSGVGGVNTFVSGDPNYYDTTNGRSADYQIIQIGANIIDGWDIDNLPTFIGYAANQGVNGFARRLAGVDNIPYLEKLVFAPYYTNHGQGDQFYAWLVPTLWNPHQNAVSAIGDVRFAMTSGSMTATVVDNKDKSFTSGAVAGAASGPYIQVQANAFSTPYPPALNPTNNITATSGSPMVSETFTSGKNYYGLYFPFTYPDPNNIDDKSADHAFPTFTSGPTFEMQINVNPTSPSGVWRAYQTWKGCTNGTQAAPSLACTDPKGAGGWKNNKLMDPEFVNLDPRTIRFGVWGSDAHDTGKKKGDFQDGAEDSMDQSGNVEQVNALNPQPAAYSPPAVQHPIPIHSTFTRPIASQVIGTPTWMALFATEIGQPMVSELQVIIRLCMDRPSLIAPMF